MGTLQNPDSLIPKEVSAALAALETRCMQAIQNALDTGANMTGGVSPFGGSIDSQSSGMPAMPFMAFWNVSDSTWDMCLPRGSLVVDGETVELEKPSPVRAGKNYLHVNTKKSPVQASIDGNAEKSDCDYNIPLFDIATDGGKFAVVKTQYHLGTMIIGQSANAKGCFEPKYDERGKITGVLCPYVMCGRQVIKASGTPSNGVNVVRVKHSGDSVSATITSGSATPSNSSNTSTDIPLYKIKDGKITEDYRNMPRVPLYDPKAS